MTKQDLLEYVEILIARHDAHHRRLGLHAWGIAAAFGALLFTALPHLSQSYAETGSFSASISAVGIAIPIFIQLFLFTRILAPRPTAQPTDYRVTKRLLPASGAQLVYLVIFFLALPISLTLFQPPDIANERLLVLWRSYNFLFLSLIFFATLYGISYHLISMYKYKLPAPVVLPQANTSRQDILSKGFFAAFLFIGLALGSAVLLTVAASAIRTGHADLLAGLSLAAMIILPAIFLSNVTNNYSLYNLERLERDLVFESMPLDELKRRLEAEHIGVELGHWFSDRRMALSAHSREMQNRAQALEDFDIQLERATPEDVSNRWKEYDIKYSEFDASLTKYLEEVQNIIEWIEVFALPHLRAHDSIFTAILSDHVAQLTRDSTEARRIKETAANRIALAQKAFRTRLDEIKGIPSA